MKNIFNFKVALSTKSINNILRLATLAAACLALPTHALAQSSCPADLNDDGEVNGADVGLVLIDYGPCPAPTPSISLVNPSSGQTTGFTAFTIFGTNFTGATSVTVGGVAATSIVVVSSTAITALSPAHSVGAVDIVVVTPNGTATLVGAFTYIDSSWYTILEQAPNPTVVPDAAVRANIVASGYPWRVRDNSSGIEMLLIPGGTFTMGCSASTSYGCNGDETNHQVTLSKAFYLGKTEVTQAQWQAKMSSNPSYFKGYSDSPSRPVETVSWNDIAGFNTATGLRLPSEAEWEYAYRGGTTTAFHSMPGYPNGTNDDSLLGNIAWYSVNNGASGSSTYGTKPVAGKAANAFGMYDMSGNVYEWCNDWYGSTYYTTSPSTDPAGPSLGSARVLRGGGWYGISFYCRSSDRVYDGPDGRDDGVGFRVARTP
jgi:formylglycine-generating enzyme required for sulfatase activity